MDSGGSDSEGRWTRRLILAGGALVVAALGAAVVLVVAGGSSTRRSRTTATASTRSGATATTTPAPGLPAAPTPAPPGPPAQPAPSGPEQFGVSVNRLFNDLIYTPAQIDAQLAALRTTGATVARTDAFWEGAEPAAPVGGVHHYDWRFDDSIAASLASHDLTWLPIIDYTAYWAETIPGRDHSPPAVPDDYAAYAAAFAQRYGPGGAFWVEHPALAAKPVGTYEIWNEPDGAAFWNPTPNAAAYADLYARARDAILAVQPSARVIVGGLAGPATFLPAMLAARPALRGHVDGVAIHPYGATPLGVLTIVRSVRAVMSSLGMARVPLYVTEFGWTTRPPTARAYVSAALRPGYLRGTLQALRHVDCSVAMTIVYTWVTPERNPKDGEDWFGIHSPSGAATVDSRAFTAGLRAAATPGASVNLCGST
ncbi:MAG TPA: hypothetical protein VMU39_27825 [Solirubrobacteraceae bacterium]|nr:hypothetical protein [Solirubrobacteraceae bacterium]